MKISLFDKVLASISPERALRRIRSKMAIETVQRKYDITTTSRKNAFSIINGGKAREEVGKAYRKSSFVAQELVRNNPLANRIKRVWANSIVGHGIKCGISSRNSRRSERFSKTFDEWASSTYCDYEGNLNLYGLQWLWAATMVESGGVFVVMHVVDDRDAKIPVRLQTLEQSDLDSTKDNGKDIFNGIMFSKYGEPLKYFFNGDGDPVEVDASNVIHFYRKERRGQHLGMTFFAPVATTLDDYATLNEARVLQQQIAACFAVVFEGTDDASIGMRGKGDYDDPDEIEPGMVYKSPPGSNIHTISPPKVDNSKEFDMSLRQDIALGVGITYEQLTGDYSKVTFASGRMGKSEFHTELDNIQHTVFKPGLDKLFSFVSKVYVAGRSGGVNDYVPDWTFPPRQAVNPKEEFDVLMSKVRHAMMSPQKAAKTLGENLEDVVQRWKEAKDLFDDLPFDIDPSAFAATGNQVMPENKEKGSTDEQS